MENNELNWKRIGTVVTRKLLYYSLVLAATVMLGTAAAGWMSEKDTATNVAGMVLAVGVIGGVVTVVAREANQLFKSVNK